MKEILKYIGYVMSIAGFAVLIWRSSASFEKLNNKVNDVDAKMEVVLNSNKEIRKEQALQSIRIDAVISNQGMLEHNQEILKTSYSNHLAKDKRYEELIQYLKLFEFKVEKAVKDTLQFNMLIRKKQ
jgi:hypothetical protein